jgi:hypothetical protein
MNNLSHQQHRPSPENQLPQQKQAQEFQLDLSANAATKPLKAHPLAKVTVSGLPQNTGQLEVWDGLGTRYHHAVAAETVCFTVSGALGTHHVLAMKSDGSVAARAVFVVEAATALLDGSGKFSRLLHDLEWTMFDWLNDHPRQFTRYNGRIYHNHMDWVRDLVYNHRGMCWFFPEDRDGVDLFVDSQRADGMIYDNYKHPKGSTWPNRWPEGNFVDVPEDEESPNIFTRIPVENDVEFSFIEALYNVWIQTGDDDWMTARLDAALRALRYSTSSPYCWSEKFQLIKRGFTIDTWDFQPQEDCISTEFVPQGDTMFTRPGETRFGIFHGDNTGTYNACLLLEEMLRHAGRDDEAQELRSFGDDLFQRLLKVSWNGEFFTHHVPEDPSVKRDFGDLDPSTQVSQSNAFALNRHLPQELNRAIILTYQRLRREMPETSPGEWFAIYPPFPKGFDFPAFQYVNGGCSLLAGGELAKGAFRHGFEEYGVDILSRVYEQARWLKGKVWTNLRGCIDPKPERNFTPVDLRDAANTSLSGDATGDVIGWIREGENDFKAMPTGPQCLAEVDFEVIPPEENGQRSVIGIGHQAPYLNKAEIPAGGHPASVYLLHTSVKALPAGNLVFIYEDGSESYQLIDKSLVGPWWYPSLPKCGQNQKPHASVAWQGGNAFSDDVGCYASGLENPCPDKPLKALRFETIHNASIWLILGVSLSDQPVWFPSGRLSGGMINIEGAATTTGALMEGLAGIQSTRPAFRTASLPPRWLFADETEAAVTGRFAASEGYLSYRYRHDRDARMIELKIASCAEKIYLRLPIPSGSNPDRLLVNGMEMKYSNETIEKSIYVSTILEGPQAHEVQLILQPTAPHNLSR